MIDPNAPKIIFSDASILKNSSYSCVLAQIVNQNDNEIYVPEYLTLDDPVHRIIFDKNLIYQPVDIIRSEEDAKLFFKSMNMTVPPVHDYLDQKYLGYKESELNNTFFISVQSLQYAYRCNVLSISHMRELIVKYINKSILRLKLNDFEFKQITEEFLSNKFLIRESLFDRNGGLNRSKNSN